MKIFVFGFDALEFKFVEHFQLSALKQKQYGTFTIPIECFREKEPWTPLVWKAFLTGVVPEDPISLVKRRREPSFITDFRKLLSMLKMNKVYGKLCARIPSYHVFLSHIIGEREYTRFPSRSTFLRSTSYTAMNFPFLSSVWNFSYPKGITIPELIGHYTERFHILQKEFWSREFSQVQIVMFYTKLLDVVGECAISDFQRMMKHYLTVNRFIHEVESTYGSDSLILIVSDHGIESDGKGFGKHSDYGFYSMNKNMGFFPRTVLDFAPFLEEELNT